MQARILQSFRWSAIGFGTALLLLAGAPDLAQAQSASSTRRGGSSASSGSSGSSTSSSSSSGRHATPRSSSGSHAGRGSATTTRHSSRGSNRRGGGRYSGGHHPHYRFGFGYGYGFHSYYYPYYYYGFGYPYWRYWEPYWYRYPAHRELGAVDINVKPKKASVYVDGALVGKSGKFDGFPGYLWLEQGEHELVFHYEGFETEVRKVRVSAGVVIDVDLWMESGESRPAEELMTQRGPAIEPRARERRADRAPRAPRAPRVQAPRAPAAEDTAPRESEPRSETRDVREEPGRFVISAEPADASVYLDGRFLGTATEMVRLHDGLIVDAGDHVLEVVRPGFESKRLDFSVEAGGSVELEVRLVPETPEP